MYNVRICGSKEKRMNMETWKQLFGKSQDDPTVKSALVAAGVKKVPKLEDDDTDVRFDLKGYGLWLLMTDEAYLKQLTDQDIGEGPLILSGVTAYLDKSVSRDLYKSKLPYDIAAGMTKVDVRKRLGPPTTYDDETLFDLWLRDGVEVIASYSKESKLVAFGLMLPGAE
jgi:hypothetical protein